MNKNFSKEEIETIKKEGYKILTEYACCLEFTLNGTKYLGTIEIYESGKYVVSISESDEMGYFSKNQKELSKESNIKDAIAQIKRFSGGFVGESKSANANKYKMKNQSLVMTFNTFSGLNESRKQSYNVYLLNSDFRTTNLIEGDTIEYEGYLRLVIDVLQLNPKEVADYFKDNRKYYNSSLIEVIGKFPDKKTDPYVTVKDFFNEIQKKGNNWNGDFLTIITEDDALNIPKGEHLIITDGVDFDYSKVTEGMKLLRDFSIRLKKKLFKYDVDSMWIDMEDRP